MAEARSERRGRPLADGHLVPLPQVVVEVSSPAEDGLQACSVLADLVPGPPHTMEAALPGSANKPMAVNSQVSTAALASARCTRSSHSAPNYAVCVSAGGRPEHQAAG